MPAAAVHALACQPPPPKQAGAAAVLRTLAKPGDVVKKPGLGRIFDHAEAQSRADFSNNISKQAAATRYSSTTLCRPRRPAQRGPGTAALSLRDASPPRGMLRS